MGANKIRDLDEKYFCETANNSQAMPPGRTTLQRVQLNTYYIA